LGGEGSQRRADGGNGEQKGDSSHHDVSRLFLGLFRTQSGYGKRISGYVFSAWIPRMATTFAERGLQSAGAWFGGQP
jgi:hypothetical protein